MSKKGKDKKGKSKEPTVIDNTDTKHELTFEKNKEFDFGDDDEMDDEIQPEAQKKKFNIVFSDTKITKKPGTSTLRALPPSKTRQIVSKSPFEKGIDSLENGEYNKAYQMFNVHSITTENKKEAQLCLSYQLLCSIFQKIIYEQSASNAYLCSLMLSLPLLPCHRNSVISFAKFMIGKYNVVLPEYLLSFINSSQEGYHYDNTNKEVLSCSCYHCHSSMNMLEFKCSCGKERLFDCLSLSPIVSPAYCSCEKCGATFNEQQSYCSFCKGNCSSHE